MLHQRFPFCCARPAGRIDGVKITSWLSLKNISWIVGLCQKHICLHLASNQKSVMRFQISFLVQNHDWFFLGWLLLTQVDLRECKHPWLLPFRLFLEKHRCIISYNHIYSIYICSRYFLYTQILTILFWHSNRLWVHSVPENVAKNTCVFVCINILGAKISMVALPDTSFYGMFYGADGFNGFVTSREANFESGLHIYIYTSFILCLYKFIHMYIICRSTVYQDGTQRWRFGSFSEVNSLSC